MNIMWQTVANVGAPIIRSIVPIIARCEIVLDVHIYAQRLKMCQKQLVWI